MKTEADVEIYKCDICGDTSCFIINTDKRLTNGELAIEWNRSAAVTAIHGPHSEGNHVAVIENFMRRPHASETNYE